MNTEITTIMSSLGIVAFLTWRLQILHSEVTDLRKRVGQLCERMATVEERTK